MSAIDRVKELLAAKDYDRLRLFAILIAEELVASQKALKRCESMISEEGWPDCTAATEARDALLMEKLEGVMENPPTS